MNSVLSLLLQFVLMLLVFLVGSFLPALHLLPMWSSQLGAGRLFVWDGLVLLVLLYLLLLVIAIARRRLWNGGRNATLAFILALVLGLLMKFPYIG